MHPANARAVHKKSLFPVQRVAGTMASRAAATSFFSLIGKYCPFLEKKLFFAKMKKKSPVGPFLVTRPLHQKHNYFYGQPSANM